MRERAEDEGEDAQNLIDDSQTVAHEKEVRVPADRGVRTSLEWGGLV